MALLRSEFSDQLRRICGGCALAFLLCIIVAVPLDARGIGGRLAATIITLLPLALYCAAGLATSTANPPEFHIADRRVSAGFAGMAAAAVERAGAASGCAWLSLRRRV
jgi:cation/acetate symporter